MATTKQREAAKRNVKKGAGWRSQQADAEEPAGEDADRAGQGGQRRPQGRGTDALRARGRGPAVGHQGPVEDGRGRAQPRGRRSRGRLLDDRLRLVHVLPCRLLRAVSERQSQWAGCEHRVLRGPEATGPFDGLQAEKARIPYAHFRLRLSRKRWVRRSWRAGESRASVVWCRFVAGMPLASCAGLSVLLLGRGLGRWRSH